MFQSELETAYATVSGCFDQATEVTYDVAINRPIVSGMLAKVSPADPDSAQQLRADLYEALLPTYRQLRIYGINSLQFVTLDGNLFLSFGRPDLVGEPMRDGRSLFDRAIDTGEPQQGFESGPDGSGIRKVFPLRYEGRLLAAVEFAMDTGTLIGRMAEHRESSSGPDTFVRLVPLGDQTDTEADETEAAEEAEFYSQHPIDEAPSASASDDRSLRIARIDFGLAEDANTIEAMAAGRSAVAHQCMSLFDCFAVALTPIQDSQGGLSAYLIAYTPDSGYAQRRARYAGIFLAGLLLLAFCWLLLRRWGASIRRLNTISGRMGEGLYLLSTRGLITDANAAACALLGYRRRELIGADPHQLFHDHNGTLGDACPMRADALRGGEYRSDEEMFRRGDGSLMRVSVTASPMQERRGVTGSIVMFRDIGAEYDNRHHLRLVETAFQNLDEAIVVTDSALRISAVNAAFTRITGYSETDVLGHNPSLLDSGRHDIGFYAAIWATLQRVGRWEGEVWSRRKTGELYPQRLRLTAVKDGGQDVGSYVGVGQDVSELRDKDDQLRELADRDQLTGLYNRGAFLDVVARRIENGAEHGRRMALLYLDLDRFKRINETLGHRVGDDMIGLVAKRVREAVRSRDVLGRIGDDEFAVLLDDLEHSGAPSDLAHQLLVLIREPLLLDENPVHLSASIGISIYPNDGLDAPTLLKNADAAMHQIKQQGRDGYRYFTPVMATEADRRFSLEGEFRRALVDGQLRLHYQPKIALSDGAITGFEALLRWQHPERGLLSPVDFLDAARDTGMVQSINAWVLGHSARQAAAWRDGGVGAGRIGCNVDGSLVSDPRSLLALLTDSISEAGIAPAELELEIVETAMSETVSASSLWQDLAAMGFELAIDDFGTGESSFARLKQLPVNTLKIDQSFVRDIETDANDRSIVRALIAMSHTLGKRVVAEGVETRAQLEFLVSAGCHGAQGYLIGHPMPAGEVEGFLCNYRYDQLGISACD